METACIRDKPNLLVNQGCSILQLVLISAVKTVVRLAAVWADDTYWSSSITPWGADSHWVNAA